MKKYTIKACVLSVGLAVMMAFSSSAQAAPNQATNATGEAYVPVRAAMNQAGLQVTWKNEAQQKLVFSNGQLQYQVILNPNEGLAKVGSAAFPYRNQQGTISLTNDFYHYILENNTFKNLPLYVSEPKPAPVQQNVTFYESGQATWYGGALHGNYTASGERFNMYDLTAAHKTLPFGTVVKVTNLQNGKSTTVRITDRGPFAPGRVIDLSQAAAQQVDMISSGVVPVNLEIVQ